MRMPHPFIFIIFGGSGDLAKRKLIPALYRLFIEKHLPENFVILGLGRQKYTDDSYRTAMVEKLSDSQNGAESGSPAEKFADHVYYQEFDIGNFNDYDILKNRLVKLDDENQIGGNYLYYLAIPPELFVDVATALGKVGLQKQANQHQWKRVILEKPFGRSLDSAVKLNQALVKIFDENQIYRIDHYLGKETVQNIFALRFANGMFEQIWNGEHISHIEVTAAENLGVENRGGYYETAGAMRDMVQNHLLQLVATIAMNPPTVFEPDAIRDEKAAVFSALRPLDDETIQTNVVRGQYIASTIRGEKVAGYREEPKVNPQSSTETFIALKLYIDNARWQGVPFYVRTGKRLPTRVSEVVIHFKPPEHQFFRESGMTGVHDNQLIIRIQPDEGILVKFGMKIPGAGYAIKNVGMDFHYSDLADTSLPEAYERLLLDALLGDSTLYARADGVEAAWRWVDRILVFWQANPEFKLYGYPAGTWGPPEAVELFDDPGMDWRYPCKNLTGEETFCEL